MHVGHLEGPNAGHHSPVLNIMGLNGGLDGLQQSLPRGNPHHNDLKSPIVTGTEHWLNLLRDSDHHKSGRSYFWRREALSFRSS